MNFSSSRKVLDKVIPAMNDALKSKNEREAVGMLLEICKRDYPKILVDQKIGELALLAASDSSQLLIDKILKTHAKLIIKLVMETREERLKK